MVWAAVLLGLMLLVLAGSYCCYRLAFGAIPTDPPDVLPKGEQYDAVRDTMAKSIAAAVALPYECVYIQSHDGLRLFGRLYAPHPGAPLQIQFHGYRGAALRDFSGGLPMALKMGCNALVVDQRAHGCSQGRCLSFGILERQDCLAWAQYARERFGAEVPIWLVGLSMGATTVLMASELALPDTVAGIIADCGFSTPRAIIRKVIRDIRLPLFPSYQLVQLGGLLFGGFDIGKYSAAQALKNSRVPVLLIHGEDDRFVPCAMTRENFDACGAEKYLFTVPGAGHGLSCMLDYPGYCRAVADFLEKTGGHKWE